MSIAAGWPVGGANYRATRGWIACYHAGRWPPRCCEARRCRHKQPVCRRCVWPWRTTVVLAVWGKAVVGVVHRPRDSAASREVNRWVVTCIVQRKLLGRNVHCPKGVRRAEHAHLMTQVTQPHVPAQASGGLEARMTPMVAAVALKGAVQGVKTRPRAVLGRKTRPGFRALTSAGAATTTTTH